MKKNLMITVAFILIFTHIIPPHNISFANDEVDACENMDFTVQTIRENDKKISGTAQPSQTLKIVFTNKNKTEVINVDTNGEFELIVEEEFLELNDAILISNDYFKIETNVVSVGSAASQIQSNKYAECPVVEETSIEEVLEESPNIKEQEDEKSVEEAASSEEPSNQESIEQEDTTDPTLDTPKIDGTSADGYTISSSDEESGNTVTLSNEADEELDSTTIKDDGTYTFYLPTDTVEQGETLSLLSEDDAGNVSNEVTVTVPTEDTTPLELEEVAIDGDSTNDYDVTGSSEPDAILSVTNTDGDEVGTGTADDEGDFTVSVTADDVSPDEELAVVATDESDNESEPSTVTVPVDQDTIEPLLSTADIKGNSTDGYTITGTGEKPDDTVYVTNEKDIKLGDSEIDEDGTYTVTLPGEISLNEDLNVQAIDTDGNKSNILTVNVPNDILEIVSVPSTIQFETKEIRDEEITIGRQSTTENIIKIKSTRSDAEWWLSAKAEPLKSDNGDTLMNTLIYKKKDTPGILLDNGAINVATNEDAISEETTDTITWAEDEGVLLKLNPIRAQANTTYKSTITWTLNDAPQ